MRTLLASALVVLLVGACGDGDGDGAATPEPTATPPAATAEAGHDLEGYSKGVRDFYGDTHPEAEPGSQESVEAEYHQPPKPAEAGLGETITLTGSNIGVRLRVTVTGVKRASEYLAVDMALESTGITNFESALENAAVTYGDGRPQRVVEGASAPCSKDLAGPIVFIPVGGRARGCLLFPASGSRTPDRLQLALEAVPVEAGGIWTLR
jgi:hypothetical protein